MEPENSNSSNNRQACAACRHQRRKCTDECILHPYLPHEKSDQGFLAAHKLFGVSNMTKMIKETEGEENRARVANALLWEALAWEQNPVGGVLAVYEKLRQDYERLKQEHEYLLQKHRQLKIGGEEEEIKGYQQQQQQQTLLLDNGDLNISDGYSSTPSCSVIPPHHQEVIKVDQSIIRQGRGGLETVPWQESGSSSHNIISANPNLPLIRDPSFSNLAPPGIRIDDHQETGKATLFDDMTNWQGGQSFVSTNFMNPPPRPMLRGQDSRLNRNRKRSCSSSVSTTTSKGKGKETSWPGPQQYGSHNMSVHGSAGSHNMSVHGPGGSHEQNMIHRPLMAQTQQRGGVMYEGIRDGVAYDDNNYVSLPNYQGRIAASGGLGPYHGQPVGDPNFMHGQESTKMMNQQQQGLLQQFNHPGLLSSMVGESSRYALINVPRQPGEHNTNQQSSSPQVWINSNLAGNRSTHIGAFKSQPIPGLYGTEIKGVPNRALTPKLFYPQVNSCPPAQDLHRTSQEREQTSLPSDTNSTQSPDHSRPKPNPAQNPRSPGLRPRSRPDHETGQASRNRVEPSTKRVCSPRARRRWRDGRRLGAAEGRHVARRTTRRRRRRLLGSDRRRRCCLQVVQPVGFFVLGGTSGGEIGRQRLGFDGGGTGSVMGGVVSRVTALFSYA
ncbi:hypothetical protein Tsubulata_002068 [Turnera subulata]|uniref:LOB domain-containing protein n=1 Tax=Turnera subulata TaxID=218843 RepID=A0A9Q0FYS7_9ROSI|nr:hypothetical protein Tsubulata_002068 [Turnera subulata]